MQNQVRRGASNAQAPVTGLCNKSDQAAESTLRYLRARVHKYFRLLSTLLVVPPNKRLKVAQLSELPESFTACYHLLAFLADVLSRLNPDLGGIDISFLAEPIDAPFQQVF